MPRFGRIFSVLAVREQWKQSCDPTVLHRRPQRFGCSGLCRVILFIVAGCFLEAGAQTAPLKWGGDAEGGAPYQFQDPRNPSRIIGFEVEIADAIGRILGRPTEFVQNQWDGLVPGLGRGDYDMIISGLEITPDRVLVINFSRPYYVTFEQLAVRKDNDSIRSLEDCSGKTVGTLKGSLAERILEGKPGIDVRSYDGQVNAYEDLLNGRLDAVLMDHIIALYNVATQPELRMAGSPVGRLEYGIGIRKEDTQLLADVNRALSEMTSSGELRRILERWGLWTQLCAEYFADHSPGEQRSVAYEDYLAARQARRSAWDRARQYLSYLPLLGKGAIVTLELSVLAMALAICLGLIVALTRLYAPATLRFICNVYIESIRGTPLLIQLFLIFYGLPHIGIRFSPMLAAIIGLALNYSAYEAENYRAGIQSIPRTQMEAALALGMTRIQALRYVIVPQAMRLVIPPVTNDFIALLKDSSLVSVITMVELTKSYSQLASIHYDYLGIGLLAAAMYFLIGLPFVRLARMAESYFNPQHRRFPVGGKQRQAGD